MALADDLRRHQEFTGLQRLLGDKTAREIVDLIIGHYPSGVTVVLGALMLKLECDNARTAHQQIDVLAARRQEGAVVASLDGARLDGALFGVEAADSEARKAARWLCYASNSDREAGEVAVQAAESVIGQAVRVTPIHTFEGIKAVNWSLLFGRQGQPYRFIATTGGNLPSSVTGQRLLELALGYAATVPRDAAGWRGLAGFLLGAVLRAHGFVDGNGRTARAAYAIALLKGGVPFQAVTVRAENELSGLGGG